MRKNYILFFAFLLLGGSTMAQQVFTDDYAPSVSFTAFGGSNNSINVDNVEKHSGTASLKVDVPAGGYTGGAFVSASPLSLTAYNALTFWVKASKAATLNVSGIGNNAASTTYAAEYNNVAVTTSWSKIIVPIPDASKLTAVDGLFHFAEGSDEGAYTLWFDDIMYESLAAGIIGTPTDSFTTQTIIRTIGSTFTVAGTNATFPVNSVNQFMTVAPAYFNFTSSNPSVASINATGEGTAVNVGSANITGTLLGVPAHGVLTVNVTAASDPTTAAPTPPARSATDVISLYSNAYTNVPVDTWSAPWDQADVADVMVAGNDTKKYTNVNYAGIEFTSQTVNATAMTYFHIDIWTPNSTQFRIKLVDFGANGTYAGGDDTEHELTFTPTLGQWVSYDIPLTDFTNLAARAHLAQLILSGSSSTIYVDNVYFYKNGVAPVKLVNFNALKEGNKVSLVWNTASESNNKGFYVQASTNQENWSNVSFVKGAGTSNQNNGYNAIDANPAKGINYYRLKQVDFDGKFTYSPIRTVNFTTKGNVEVSSYPNPARDRITITTTEMSAKNTKFEIIDATGKVVKRGSFTSAFENAVQVSVDVNDFSKGVYIIKVYDETNMKTTSFVHN